MGLSKERVERLMQTKPKYFSIFNIRPLHIVLLDLTSE